MSPWFLWFGYEKETLGFFGTDSYSQELWTGFLCRSNLKVRSGLFLVEAAEIFAVELL